MESKFKILYDHLINSQDKGQINGLKINKLIPKVLDSIGMSSNIGCIDLFRYVLNTVHKMGFTPKIMTLYSVKRSHI